MYRFLLLFLPILFAPASPAQLFAQQVSTVDTRYDGQIRAIEKMIEEGKYILALAQSEALTQEGNQQQLSDVEAYGRFLTGRVMLENPASTNRDRISGVRELRRASRGFTNAGMTERVDSIAAKLKDIAHLKEGEIDALPGIAEMRSASGLNENLEPEELDNSTLGAIVALQNQQIEALNDSQLRQLVKLQQQDMEIDSFEFQVVNDSLLLLRQDMELETQRALTQEERQRRNFFIVLAVGVLLALGLLYLRYRTSQRFRARLSAQNEVIEREQKRSDELLLNILPLMVAQELKENGKATARSYETASVLFSDFVGFSTIASRESPEALVAMLDRSFRAFDEIIERHGLEKIKTIGDAYMCVGGIPTADPDHANSIVDAALEIQVYLKQEGVFQARIGIHSGPVVAGVVGQKKFAYDIWGDTVNQASRLEAAGKPGEVTVSHATCQLLKEEFVCDHAGTFEAKNIGVLDRYTVRSKRLTKKPS